MLDSYYSQCAYLISHYITLHSGIKTYLTLLLTCWSEGHSKSVCLYLHKYAMVVKRIYTTAALETLSFKNRHICCLSAPTTALYIKTFSHTLHLCFILYTEDAILFIICHFKWGIYAFKVQITWMKIFIDVMYVIKSHDVTSSWEHVT